VMEVNFFALVELTREALPHLKEGDDALIVNISSVLGKRAAPHSSEYSASKFAVEGFSQSLRAEVAKHGIGVLVVCPGTTETEFFDVVIERTSQPNWPEHKAVPAEEVARQTIRAMRCRRSEITPYFWGRMMCLLNRISPSLVDRMMRRYA